MGRHGAPRRNIRGQAQRDDGPRCLERALHAVEVSELRAEMAGLRADIGAMWEALALAYGYASIQPPAGFTARHLRAVPDQRDEAG